MAPPTPAPPTLLAVIVFPLLCKKVFLHICCFIEFFSELVSDFVLFFPNVFCSEIKLEWTDRTHDIR